MGDLLYIARVHVAPLQGHGPISCLWLTNYISRECEFNEEFVVGCGRVARFDWDQTHAGAGGLMEQIIHRGRGYCIAAGKMKAMHPLVK